ncbi:hypothetical protein IWQ61_003288 [Dispira simplex]|nr:hypothetical protein IWQ61_003288 [Dispira simplex]
MRLSLALLVAAVLLCLTHVWAYPTEDIPTQGPTHERNDVKSDTNNNRENPARWKEVKNFTKEDVQDLKDFVSQYYTSKRRSAEFKKFSHKVGGPEQAVKDLHAYYQKWYRRPGFFFNSLKAKWGKRVYDHYGQRNFTEKPSKLNPADYVSYEGKQMYHKYRYTLPFESVDDGIDPSGTRSTTSTSTAPNGEEFSGTSGARKDSVVAEGSKPLDSDPPTEDDEYSPWKKGGSEGSKAGESSKGKPGPFALDGKSNTRSSAGSEESLPLVEESTGDDANSKNPPQENKVLMTGTQLEKGSLIKKPDSSSSSDSK